MPGPSRSRNPEEKQQRRQTILDAAMDTFFTRGYERCSMDHIARAAAISRSLLYVYFRDKTEIFLGLCEQALETLLDAMEATTAACRAEPGLKQVRALGLSYYQFYCEQTNAFRILCMRASLASQLAAEESELHQQLEQLEMRIMQTLVTALKTGAADQSIASEQVSDPLQTALFLRGALHGTIMLQEQAGCHSQWLSRIDSDQLIRFSIDSVTRALSPQP